jgi:hypothetical protein
MAEIASAYPTPAACTYWAEPDEEQELGLVDRVAQPDRPVRDRRRHQLSRRAFLNATIITPLLATSASTYDNTTELSRALLRRPARDDGHPDAVELAMNIAGINLVALLNQVSVWWHIAIVAAVVILVFLAGKPDSPADAVRHPAARHRGRWNNNLGFVNLGVRSGDTTR